MFSTAIDKHHKTIDTYKQVAGGYRTTGKKIRSKLVRGRPFLLPESIDTDGTSPNRLQSKEEDHSSND